MTINQLENFVAVAETGSFSQAAERLFLSPQALIQKIARMEQELGFKLLTRSPKGVRLSAAGEEFYQMAKRLTAEYSHGVERAAEKDKASSTLRIGLPECVAPAYLMAVCRAFQERCPQIKLNYQTYSRQETIKALRAGKIDIGAQIRPEEDTPYFSEKLFPAPHFCLVSRESELASCPRIDLADLNNRTLGYCGPAHAYHTLEERIRLSELNIQLRSVPEAFSDALAFCLDGGVLLASVPMISYLKNSLAVIPFGCNLGFSYYLSYTQKDNEAIRLFIAAAHEVAASEQHPWKLTLGENTY